jgi:hypothetical protein
MIGDEGTLSAESGALHQITNWHIDLNDKMNRHSMDQSEVEGKAFARRRG